MPLIHYHTLRKLIAHLSEVVKYRDVNKATTENLAKVRRRISSSATRADGLLVPIHMWQREDRPFNVKIDLAAEEVCRKAVARRGFDAPMDGNYAIFEVILDGALSRRLTPFEKLSHTVIDHWLTWKCADGYFLFDYDHWPYDDSELDFFYGKVKIAEPGSKAFRSYEMKVENGLTAYKHDKLWKEWNVTESIFYSGCTTNRKVNDSFIRHIDDSAKVHTVLGSLRT
uniref:Restriction endonuclease n=1 Tax=Angiostrongylus cantonensis TaxID=6313 RepID=A0A0K0CTV5_ANGCA